MIVIPPRAQSPSVPRAPRNGNKRPKHPAKAAAFTAWRAGRMTGFDEIDPRSLPKAITEPVNVTAPTSTPMKISTSWIVFADPTRPGSGERYAAYPTRTAATPTNEWRMATSSGMLVIATRFASTAPTMPPTPSVIIIAV